MPTPATLAEVVETERMELELMRRRAMADGVVTHEEAVRIFERQERFLDPNLVVMTTSWTLIGSITRGSAGVYSPRFMRTCRELWSRRRNVTPIRRERLDDFAA